MTKHAFTFRNRCCPHHLLFNTPATRLKFTLSPLRLRSGEASPSPSHSRRSRSASACAARANPQTHLETSFSEWIFASTVSDRPGSPCLREDRLRHLRVQYLPEIVEIGEGPFFPSFALDRLDDSDQTAGIVLLKPVNANDVVLHGFLLAGHSYITKEVTGRLQEEKKDRKWEKKIRVESNGGGDGSSGRFRYDGLAKSRLTGENRCPVIS